MLRITKEGGSPAESRTWTGLSVVVIRMCSLWWGLKVTGEGINRFLCTDIWSAYLMTLVSISWASPWHQKESDKTDNQSQLLIEGAILDGPAWLQLKGGEPLFKPMRIKMQVLLSPHRTLLFWSSVGLKMIRFTDGNVNISNQSFDFWLQNVNHQLFFFFI